MYIGTCTVHMYALRTSTNSPTICTTVHLACFGRVEVELTVLPGSVRADWPLRKPPRPDSAYRMNTPTAYLSALLLCLPRQPVSLGLVSDADGHQRLPSTRIQQRSQGRLEAYRHIGTGTPPPTMPLCLCNTVMPHQP